MCTEFLNPYNFIPFPKKKALAYSEETEKHTGVIEYTITTRSPLFIPNTSSDKAFACNVEEHGCYDFYSYTELDEQKTYERECLEPVIPGSELRGMLRSIYETLTDSCMGVLNEDVYPVMRISESYKAALLKKCADGTYFLVEAEDCIYRKKDERDFVNLYKIEKTLEGSEVYFNKKNRGGRSKSLIAEISEKQDSSHSQKGYLIKGMSDASIGKKHNCHVFIPNKEKGALTKQDISRLEAVIAAYQQEPNASSAYEEYNQQLKKFLKGKGNEYFPVYYSEIKDGNKKYMYLAPACFTKEPSNNSLKELAGEFASCKSLEKSCPCCSLFGMVGNNHEQARASKIRFTDARVRDNKQAQEYYDNIVTLETLGSPRLNNVEFYLQKPEEADFWNYDYYTVRGKLIAQMGTLRGRKYYWHQKDKILRKDVEQTGLNKTVRPVSSGNTFIGKVYFEGITQKQLSQLLWLLNGGNDREQPQTGQLAYKLGMGKPLGLGSVELKVTKLTKRNILLGEDSIAYEVKEEIPDIPMYEEAGFSASVKEDFFTIASLEATKGKLVTYPIVDGQQNGPMTEGYKWFVENHIGFKYDQQRSVKMPQKRIEMKRKYALPPIKDVQMLPMRLKDSSSGREGKQSKWEKSKNTQFRDKSVENEKKWNLDVKGLRKGDILLCQLTSRVMENKFGEGYFAYVRYQGYKGCVFGVPHTLENGSKVKLVVTYCKQDEFKGDYVECL